MSVNPGIGIKSIKKTKEGITMTDPLELVIDTLIKLDARNVANDVIEQFNKIANSIEQMDSIAKLAFRTKNYKLSIDTNKKILNLFERDDLIKSDPAYAARSNLINALAHDNRPEEALGYISIQEQIKLEDKDRLLKKAYCLFLNNNKKEAEDILLHVLSQPNIDEKTVMEINFNLGTYDLWNGKFKQGLNRFLKYGPMFNTWNRKGYPATKWTGQLTEDITLFIAGEAGIGDEFINIRFVPRILREGMKVIWITDRVGLHSIFKRSIGCEVAKNYAEAIELNNGSSPDYYAYSMDLPAILDIDVDDLWHGPYIKPDPVYIKKHKHISSSLLPDSLNIGLRWKGSPYYEQDNHRTIDIDGIISMYQYTYNTHKLFSLQDDITDERLIDLRPQLTSWEDTLGVIYNLDLVITSCTSIAHAASAMGKKTIVLPPISAYYIWCNDSRQSHWYGESTIVLHQKKPRDWSYQIEEIKKLTTGE